MLADLGKKFDLRVLLLTTIAVLVVSIGGAVLNAAMGGGRTPCAYAAGSVCEGDIVVYEYAEDVVVSPGNTIQINGSLLAVNNGSTNVTIHQILAGAVGDVLTMIRKAGATGTVTIDSDCGSATADVICLPGNQDWVIDSLYDSINFVKRPGSEFWTQVSRTDNAPKDVGVHVYNNANISAASSAYTVLTFNSERYDTDGIHSTTTNTNRLTVTRSGKYEILGSAQWANNATGYRMLGIRLNGVTWIGFIQNVAISSPLVQQASSQYQLNVGDYVELLVYQNSGVALNILAEPNYSPEFSMQQVGN